MLIFRGVAMKSCFMTSSISQAGALPARKAPLEEASPKSEAEEIAEEIFWPEDADGYKMMHEKRAPGCLEYIYILYIYICFDIYIEVSLYI